MVEECVKEDRNRDCELVMRFMRLLFTIPSIVETTRFDRRERSFDSVRTSMVDFHHDHDLKRFPRSIR